MVKGLIKNRSILSLVTAAISILMILLIITPLVMTVRDIISRGEFLTAFYGVITDFRVFRILLNTIFIIGIATLIALIVGVLLAWVVERTDAELGWITRALPIFPLMIPTFASSIGWIILATPNAGYLNKALDYINDLLGISLPHFNIFSWTGLVILYAINMLPVIYMTVGAAMRNLDPSLEESSRIAGDNIYRTFFKITLPLIRPAIASSALLGGIFSLSLFVVPRMIGTQANIDILTVEIVRLLVYISPSETDRAIILTIFLILLIGILSYINMYVSRKMQYSAIGGRASTHSLVLLPKWLKIIIRFSVLTFLFIFSVLPFAALILVSVQPFWTGDFTGPYTLNSYKEIFFGSTQVSFALNNSLKLSLIGTTISMIIALFIAYRLQWQPNQMLSRFTDSITKLPGALSHIVIAVGVLVAFAGPPINLANTLTILMICYLILYIPMATTSSQSALLQVGRDMSEAAWISGDKPGMALRRITIPLVTPALISGWVFVFVLILNDVTASAILSGPNSPVVGFTVLHLFENGTYPILAALATLVSVISSIIVIGILFLSDRISLRHRKITKFT